MPNDNYEERRKEKTIEQLTEEAREVLRKAEPSLRMSMVLSLGPSRQTGCLAPPYFQYQS